MHLCNYVQKRMKVGIEVQSCAYLWPEGARFSEMVINTWWEKKSTHTNQWFAWRKFLTTLLYQAVCTLKIIIKWLGQMTHDLNVHL